MLLKFGFTGTAEINNIVNACFTFGNDGIVTWYGYRSATFGTITPDNVNGLLIYAFEYQVDGTMRMTFGVAGNEKIPNVDQIMATSADKTQYTLLVWNSINSAYEAADLEMATYLIAKSEECLSFSELPDTFIDYNLEIKTAEG